VSALIAKSSVAWSTLLYMLTNQSIRKRLNWKLFQRGDAKNAAPESIALTSRNIILTNQIIQ